jgi:type II secretory pathway pseudopilin PulG
MKNFVGRMSKIGNRGSTLIAVMVVTTILSLFLITLQPIMLNYAKGSVDERDLKQAEFSARSANDAIVKGILDGNATLISGINSISSDGSSLVLDDFTFSSSQMGSVEARIERVSASEFSVITRATVNETQRTIGRVINKVGSTGGSSHTPLPAFYFNNIDGSNIQTTGNTPVVVNGSFSGAGGTDIYISGDLYILDNSSISFTGSAYMFVGGDFYTQTGTFGLGGNSSVRYKGILYNKRPVPTLRNSTVANTINTFNTDPTWVKNTGTTYTSSLSLNGGSYYVMNGSVTVSNITSQLSSSVTPSNPVYIILRTGSTLNLSNAIDPPVGGVPKDPRIVFILEGTATLNAQHQSSLVVFGRENTSFNVNNSSGGIPILYGQIRVGSISYSGSYVTLNYRASTTYNPNPGTVTWTVGNYKKATY